MISSYTVRRISDPNAASALHAYFDLCPESPNGQWVTYFAFDGDRPGPGRVMICRRDGTEQRAIGYAPLGKANEGAKQMWIGNDAVAYHVLGDGNPRTIVVSLDTGEEQVVPHALRSYSPANGMGLAPSLNAQGFEDGDEAIYLLDIRTGESRLLYDRDQVLAVHPLRRRILNDAAKAPSQFYFKKPEWSHDGTHFFFVFTNALDTPRPKGARLVKSLFLSDAAGTDLRCLGEFGRAPMWGPENRFVYTVDRFRDGSHTVMAHPVDGSAPQPLVPRVLGTHANLSPDGSRIAIDVFDCPDWGQASLWLYQVPSGERQVLVEFGAPDLSHETGVHPHPAWSRDGKRIYLAIGEENVPHLYAVDLEE